MGALLRNIVLLYLVSYISIRLNRQQTFAVSARASRPIIKAIVPDGRYPMPDQE